MVHTHIFKESIPGRKLRDDLCRRSRVHFNYSHEVIFMIHPKGVDELTQKLHDVSDPESQEYGKHLTRTEVVTMTANTVGRDAVVMYLQLNHATVVSQTLDGNYVTALATIEVWERTFDTEFFMFHQTHSNGYVKEVVRAEGYSIPKELSEHVKYVLKVVDIPFPVRRRSLSSSSMKRVDQPSPKRSRPDKRNTESASESLLSLKRMVTPDKIRSYYNMTNYEGSEYSVQAVYASGGQNISPLDLKLFQEEFSIVQDVIPIRGHANHTVCTVESLLCAESNLDIQYIMGISPMSPTFHWYYPGDFADWLIEISNTVDPPLVLSISYGSQEYRVTKAEHYAFDYEAIKLGVVGVSIFVAAGDDGANGSEAKYLGKINAVCAVLYCTVQPILCNIISFIYQFIHLLIYLLIYSFIDNLILKNIFLELLSYSIHIKCSYHSYFSYDDFILTCIVVHCLISSREKCIGKGI